MQLPNYSQVFDKYVDQNWNENSKLSLLLTFLDQHAHQIVTPRLFDDFLSQVVNEENSYDPFGNDFLLRSSPETD